MNKALLTDIAIYCNESWRGGFTAEELDEMITTYEDDLNESIIQGQPLYSIESLIEGLKEDVDNGSDKAGEFIAKLQSLIFTMPF